jgi:DNA polymerase elongation subunit (family B)
MKPSLEKLKNTKKYLTSISTIEYVNQYSRKILINSLYGALGNNHFRFYDLRNAEAVTSTGQLVIQWGGHVISNKLNQVLKTNDKDYIVYQDTDSVVGNTLIKTSNGEFQIADLYDMLSGNIETRGDNNFIKHVSEKIDTLSVNTKFELESKQIKYIMKHKVKKKLYKITCGDKSITVTEDHSVMINRNNILTSVKPFEILPTDKILFL